jgi:hypothetical protein
MDNPTPLTVEDAIGALALALVSYRPDDETLAAAAETIADSQLDYLTGAGLAIVQVATLDAARATDAELRERIVDYREALAAHHPSDSMFDCTACRAALEKDR